MAQIMFHFWGWVFFPKILKFRRTSTHFNFNVFLSTFSNDPPPPDPQRTKLTVGGGAASTRQRVKYPLPATPLPPPNSSIAHPPPTPRCHRVPQLRQHAGLHPGGRRVQLGGGQVPLPPDEGGPILPPPLLLPAHRGAPGMFWVFPETPPLKSWQA